MVLNSYKGILLDAYGVFWGGNGRGPLEGAKEAMEELIKKGHIVGILSNATALSESEKKKWAEHGIHEEVHYHFLLTSGTIARALLLERWVPYQTFWVWMGDHPHYQGYKKIFEGTPYQQCATIEAAEFIYLNVPHLEGKDVEELRRFEPCVKTIVQKGLPLLCANPDHFVYEGEATSPVVRQGGIASLYEKAGGKVSYIGKPHSDAYSFAREEFRQRGILEAEQIIMVGDVPETDIRGARLAGMGSALITRTGIFAERIAKKGFAQALSELPSDSQPDFLMDRLCLDCILT